MGDYILSAPAFPVSVAKVPFIARCPGRVPAGIVNTDLVSHYDFMPTIQDYVGLSGAAPQDLAGRSFADILRGQPGGHEAVVIFDEYGPTRMIRDVPWKYVHRYPDGPHELCDLQEDPRETHKPAAEAAAAARIAVMRGRLGEWFARYVDPARDGVGEPVTGRGQIDLAGSACQGRRAFEPR